MEVDFRGVALSDCFLSFLEEQARNFKAAEEKKKKSLHCP
jgi:hypothetical protein